MDSCKPINTSLETKLDFKALNSDEKYNAPCQSVIRCLMYIMVCTRPDLCVAVSILYRYTNKRNKELWNCLKRVLRYLQNSIDIKLTYTRSKYDGILTGYIDSDWEGNDTSDRKSTTGYMFKLFELCIISEIRKSNYPRQFHQLKLNIWLYLKKSGRHCG